MENPKEHGEVQPDAKDSETNEDRQLSDAKQGRRTLADIGKRAVAEHIKKRWERLEKVARERLAHIKLNWLRYKGYSFAQIHPNDPNRVFVPPGSTTKRAPTINKIERTVDRYVAQITADEPLMEAVPASHSNEDRDAAEAATAMLRGEFERMDLVEQLRRVMAFAAVMRSGFWFFQWDPDDGAEEKAQKFFEVNGRKVLLPVDSSGNRVDDPSKAATIRLGNIKLSVMSPANVRWDGARYAHDAREVVVAEVMKLRDVYEAWPKTREAKVSELLCGEYKPTSGSEWLEDLRGESQRGARRKLADSWESRTGESMDEIENILDEPVLIQHYFRRKGKTYKQGFQALAAGEYLISRGNLRYGIIPVAHFKFLDALSDVMGRALVDLLRDPQELLDFVNGQILRYLQMLKRRWFVPQFSGVKARDLMSPTRSIIEYNPQAGKPEPEVQAEIPNSLVDWVERFDADYDDLAGIHDTLQGKHVPGVSSGRHAEALRSGDETLLGLTRAQMKIGLRHGARIILAMVKKEWRLERRVRYTGENRQYLERAFRNTDFGQTTDAVLKNSTLLMLTPAQRLDTVMSMAEAGALTVDEVRQLAPLGDVMGISITEDVHYQRARRQNERFLQGPPKPLMRARKRYEEAMLLLQAQQQDVSLFADLAFVDQAGLAAQKIERDLATFEAEWQLELEQHSFDHRNWEDSARIAKIHADVHAEALSHEKAETFPEWWVDLFEAHATLEWQLGYAQEYMQALQLQQLGAQAQIPGQGSQTVVDGDQVPTSPAGLTFDSGTPDVVSGQAP